MFRTLRPFFIALLSTWAALWVAAFLYERQHPLSHWIMTAALPALLVEAFFYLAAGFEQTREYLRSISSRRTQAGILWITALIPYLVFSFTARTFDRDAFYLLAALCAVLAFWYAVFPWRFAYDAGFLVIAAAPIVLRTFQRIYFSPDAHTRVDVLGHLMWIRLGIAALLVLREWNPGWFSFWPEREEWKAGIVYYVLVLAPIAALAMALHDVRFAPIEGEWWQITAVALGTFFGVLWVVALGEELFFRGVIERAMLDTWRSPVLAIAISAALFGSAHLWFHTFPDWRRALVAALLGVACGIAYWRTGSVRVPMVTHAFVVTTWRVLFK
ncbi:MAG: CPBP family intramembrane metalloprotease [Acidobacteriaceae bacterium]|nr:CPBP family intramembrane metalloprotease [Acidobacteriaceae bacterium]